MGAGRDRLPQETIEEEKGVTYMEKQTPYIYESPDGGTTVYRRTFMDYDNRVTIQEGEHDPGRDRSHHVRAVRTGRHDNRVCPCTPSHRNKKTALECKEV